MVQALVIGLGELLWDCFADGRQPGGAPANVAFHARQLGLPAVILSRVGHDQLGRELVQLLADRQLDVSHIQIDPRRPTGTATVDTANVSRPIFTIRQQVAWDYLAFTEDWAAVLSTAAAVCFGTLMQRTDANRRTLDRCLQAAPQALAIYDLNLRRPWYQPAWVRQGLQLASVLKFADEEASRLRDLLGSQSAGDIELAKELIARHELRAVFVTRGPSPAAVVLPDQVIEQPPPGTPVVDTVGAGDAFTAGVIYGLLHDWPPARTLTLANQIASLVVARPVAMPELGAHCRQLLQALANGAT